VLGTAQLIRLALHQHRKRFDDVSTIGVLEGPRAAGKVLELDGVDALQSEWPVAGGYAHGYATSKWASEVLLKQAHGRFRTPVRVFRPGMILPDRRYRGQANVPDLLTRLLASIIHIGLAPRSFYAEGEGARAHFDGLPADFIAAAMVALSSANHADLATFQVSNAHWDDGVSLDTLIDWVGSAGYPLERIDDYAAWYSAFSARLQALPAGERQHSSLPILHQWAQPAHDWESERADASRFREEVRRHHPSGEADIPHLTEAFLHKYLADLQALDVLKG
jgi:fatty acid CoA ligase FadD9